MKDRSSNEKATIYLAIFFILVLVVVLVLYFLGIIGGKDPSVDVVLNRDVMITYTKDKWEKVLPKDYIEYNWNKFSVYEEGQKKGTYSLYTPDGDFYLFEVKGKERTPIDSIANSIFIGGKTDSEFVEFEREDFTEEDKTYVKSILKKNDVSDKDLDNYIQGYKIVEDFDNDNEKENMYIISNMFSMQVSDTGYSLIFIKDDDKVNYIYKNVVKESNRYSNCFASLLGLIKIDGNNHVQIITNCKSYSVSNNNEYGIYQNRYNKYELLLYIK